ncbi:hypothetical protein MJO28_003083 [Puccinia striiformis f. sp. tritici]|uniref:J domain-containing protein n=2 Tax=Puccinia striiformis f. sp. tritici TaxID=168172 RepID=A0A0L0UYH2_9BASI|nr:hypothetical protein MJO28_003083 [Puccinia striiformis f. sp. tritici]KNE91809.1 hypothetical protein PSTG_14769 [Puccinia striiformis f. sp. tritici PST-78]
MSGPTQLKRSRGDSPDTGVPVLLETTTNPDDEARISSKSSKLAHMESAMTAVSTTNHIQICYNRGLHKMENLAYAGAASIFEHTVQNYNSHFHSQNTLPTKELRDLLLRIHDQLVQCYIQLGSFEKAEDLLNKLLFNNDSLTITYGHSLYSQFAKLFSVVKNRKLTQVQKKVIPHEDLLYSRVSRDAWLGQRCLAEKNFNLAKKFFENALNVQSPGTEGPVHQIMILSFLGLSLSHLASHSLEQASDVLARAWNTNHPSSIKPNHSLFSEVVRRKFDLDHWSNYSSSQQDQIIQTELEKCESPGNSNYYCYYQLLLVHPTADPKIIHKSYTQLSLRLHPDKGGSTGLMRLLNDASDTLADPEKRAVYDINHGSCEGFNATHGNLL